MASDIVLILGNGFDMSLGIESSFSDFANSEFWPFSKTTDGLAGFLTKKIELDPYWSDLEGSLLEYASVSGKGSDDPFQINRDKQHFQDLNSYFTAYLQFAQQKKINEKSPAFIILNSICNKASSVIYSFNFTNLETFVGEMVEHLPVINHVHGQLRDYSIILGINDDVVVKPGYEFLYKSFSNYYVSNEMQIAMRSAKEVVIFGHSLSQVDNLYFKDFLLEYLTVEHVDTNLTILTYDNTSAENIIKSVSKYTGVDKKIVERNLPFVFTSDDEINSFFVDVVSRLNSLNPSSETSSIPTALKSKEERSLIFLAGEGFNRDYDQEKTPKPVSVVLKEAAESFPGSSYFLQTPPSVEQISGCTDLVVFGINTDLWDDYLIDQFLQNSMDSSPSSIRKRIIIVINDSAGKREVLLKLKTCCGGNLSVFYSRVDLIIFRLDGSDFHLMENLQDVLAGKPINQKETQDIEALAKSFPSSFLPRVAEMWMTFGRRYEFTTDYRKAREYYLRAADAYLELEKSSNRSFIEERVSVLLALGVLSIKYDNSEDVYESLSKALGLLPKLDKKNYLEFAPLQAECLLGIARMKTREERFDFSDSQYKKSIATFRKLVDIYPDCFLPSLVEALRWYANMLCRQALKKQERNYFGKPGEVIHTDLEASYRNEAEFMYNEMQMILKELCDDYPMVYTIPLAKTLYEIGLANVEKGFFVAGRKAYLKAAAMCNRFVKDKRKKLSREKRKHFLDVKRNHALPLLAAIEADLARVERLMLYSHAPKAEKERHFNKEDISSLTVCEHLKKGIALWEELACKEPDVYCWDFFDTLIDLFRLYVKNYHLLDDSFALEYIERARALSMRSGNEPHIYYRVIILIKYIAVIYDYAFNKKARVYYEEAVCMAYDLWKRERNEQFLEILSENLHSLRGYYKEQKEEWRFEFFKDMYDEVKAELKE